eukprot:TRINITY_DN9344_c0_g1_i1.p1 TRINITY_DN9344_c0_g1~~TRINITY_DN9344_c0_g1_i1.p1  ORF type:complete len:307 (+),score=77.09 TRINITY_DN9344_c0_g1_i1:37-921(+)
MSASVWGRNDAVSAPTPTFAIITLLGAILMPLRVLGIFLAVGTCWLSFMCLTGGDARNIPPPGPKRTAMVWIGKLCSRLVTLCFGVVFINTHGRPSTTMPRLLVSNHISYIDITVLMSIFHPSFIAKSGVKSAPLVGFIAQCMQCLFVDRSKPNNTTEIIRERIASRSAPQVLIFAEGTTTNGTAVTKFRTGAFIYEEPVEVVALRYHYAQLNPTDVGMDTAKHLMLQLCQPFCTVDLHFLGAHIPTEEEKKNPAVYAAAVRAKISEKLNLPQVDEGFEDKVQWMQHAGLQKMR